MNPSNNIAVGIDIIVDANVYFSSWGAFVCSLLLCGGLAREIYGFDIAGRATPIAKTRLGKWYVLVAASFVVMVASVRVFIAEECTKSDTVEPKCRKTKFAISAGVIGTIVSGIITLITLKFGKMKLAYEWEGALVMVVIWAVGSSQITAGDGPGQSVGNLVSYQYTPSFFLVSFVIIMERFPFSRTISHIRVNRTYSVFCHVGFFHPESLYLCRLPYRVFGEPRTSRK